MNDYLSLYRDHAQKIAAQNLLAKIQSGQAVRISTPHAVAEHEASHAIMGVIVGIPIRRVEMWRKGAEWTGQTLYHDPDWLLRVLPDGSRPLTPRGAFALGLHVLAGPLGESEGAGDLNIDAIEMATGLAYIHSAFMLSAFPKGPPEDPEEYNPLLRELTGTVVSLVSVMLDHCAGEVEAMAQSLLRTHRLAAHEVQRLTRDVSRIDLHAQFQAICGVRLLDDLPEEALQ